MLMIWKTKTVIHIRDLSAAFDLCGLVQLVDPCYYNVIPQVSQSIPCFNSPWTASLYFYSFSLFFINNTVLFPLCIWLKYNKCLFSLVIIGKWIAYISIAYIYIYVQWSFSIVSFPYYIGHRFGIKTLFFRLSLLMK